MNAAGPLVDFWQWIQDHLPAPIAALPGWVQGVIALGAVLIGPIARLTRTAVLEVLGRLYEDIAILQRAIRVGDGATLEAHFARTRAIRRGIIAANQA